MLIGFLPALGPALPWILAGIVSILGIKGADVVFKRYGLDPELEEKKKEFEFARKTRANESALRGVLAAGQSIKESREAATIQRLDPTIMMSILGGLSSEPLRLSSERMSPSGQVSVAAMDDTTLPQVESALAALARAREEYPTQDAGSFLSRITR